MAGVYDYNVELLEARKISEVFRVELYCKKSLLFLPVFVGFETLCWKF